MSIFGILRTRWFGVSNVSAPQDEVHQPKPISSGDQFILDQSKSTSNFQKAEASTVPAPLESFNSIAVKYIGFEKRFKSVLAPMDDFHISKSSEIRSYFVNELPTVVELAHMRPRTANNLISDRSAENQTIYQRLIGIACGDTKAILQTMDAISKSGGLDEKLLFDCLHEVGRHRPYEASHLMTRLFGRASTKTRLAILNEFVNSSLIGDKQAVGDLFVALLSRSTEEERQNEIYPALLSIIHNTTTLQYVVQAKRGFLAALLRGWMSEA